jgi:hypothetical protein
VDKKYKISQVEEERFDKILDMFETIVIEDEVVKRLKKGIDIIDLYLFIKYSIQEEVINKLKQ